MTVLDAALQYNALGWSIVKLAPGRKKPTQGWERWQTERQSVEDLRAMFRGAPRANIGIITGAVSGLVVVDVDTYHGGSADDLPPTGVIARTGRGGLQYFYRHPGHPVDNRTAVRPGIDVRGDGGYALVAPSDTTGNPDNDGEGGPYTWEAFRPDELGDAPGWAVTREEATTDEDEPEQEKWVSKLLLEGAPPGKRNDSLVRLAGYFAKKGFPQDVALVQLQTWAEGLDGSPMSTDEIRTTVRSAYKAERRRKRQHHVVVEEDASLLAMTSFDDYMLKHGGAITQWTIKHWLPSATIAMLVSPPQSFKTWSAFDLAVSVASGGPFLGQFPVIEPGPVAIFQQEDPHSNIAERNALITVMRLGLTSLSIEGEGDDMTISIPMVPEGAVPIYYHEERRLRFDDPAIMDALEAFVMKVRPRIVIIDPLYSAADTEDYMARAAQQMLRLKDIRDKYGCSFVIVHHTKKAMDSWDREKLWGSQFLNAFIETSWMMRGPGNERYTVLLRHFKTEGPQPFVRLTYDIHTEAPPWRYKVDVEDISAEEADKVVQAAPVAEAGGKPNRLEGRVLKRLTGHGPMTEPELAKALSVAREDVQKTMRSLLHKHRVRQDAAQRWESLDLDVKDVDEE